MKNGNEDDNKNENDKDLKKAFLLCLQGSQIRLIPRGSFSVKEAEWKPKAANHTCIRGKPHFSRERATFFLFFFSSCFRKKQ